MLRDEKPIGVRHSPIRVKNTCPKCGAVEMWRCTHIYADEGKRVCNTCVFAEEKALYEERRAAEKHLAQEAADDAVNAAREHLAGVIANLGVSQSLMQAIDALIEAHIQRARV